MEETTSRKGGGPGSGLRVPRVIASFIAVIRDEGLRASLRRVWGSSTSLGLRCALDSLPERTPARIPIRMRPAHSASEAGLLDELDRSKDADRGEVEERIMLCDAGVERLYVAREESDAPVYAQWLIGSDDHAALERACPKLFPRPINGQVLLEGAYAYLEFRRAGAMRDAMHQLLELAREEGNAEAFTYVATDYIPSIRGCAHVGFELDHMRVSTRRLFRRRISFGPADEAAKTAWAKATAPREARPIPDGAGEGSAQASTTTPVAP